MTKKAYRRFLFAAAMLVITLALTFTGPAPRAAEETCEECTNNCMIWYQQCLALGRPAADCFRGRLTCFQSCYPVCYGS